ncbi:hypothetical protein [Exiguobacterium sp. s162]|uniref:hypothetical protein n=1 Tax=Exiguobacterium sp. s162 TaxID=2751276 RepID=UPI001BE81DE8|nr:hypothetical protein [Exiguobacterium sp. s162]
MRIVSTGGRIVLEHAAEVMERKERFGVTDEVINERYLTLQLDKGATKKPTADTLDRAESKALSYSKDSNAVADYFALCRSFCEQAGATELGV